MNNATTHFLDLLAEHERGSDRSGADYALRKILNCPAPTIYEYRGGRRHLSEAHCLIVARHLNLDPLQVFAAVNADRTKNPEARAMWARAAKRTARALAVALAVMVAQGAPGRVEAARGNPARVNAQSYDLYNARNSRRRRAAELHH